MARKHTNHTSLTPSAQLGRSPSGADGGRPERGRWTSRRKAEVVLRILKGEPLDALSRELGLSTARLAEWRDDAIDGMQAALKTRQPDHRDERIRELQAKVGEQTMEMELLHKKIDHLEDGLRPPSRRPKP
jgi:transposase-like protein